MSEEMQAELLEKLQNARSAEEVIAIAKEYGREVTAEQAQELLDRLKVGGGTSEGELSDDLLEAVAGGDLKQKLHDKIAQLLFPTSAAEGKKSAVRRINL